jgi:hypothetical protein
MFMGRTVTGMAESMIAALHNSSHLALIFIFPLLFKYGI